MPLRPDQPAPLGLDQSAPLRLDQLMPLREDQRHLSGWASQYLSGQTSQRLSGLTSLRLLSGRTSLCLLDQTSHRWILSWLGWAIRLSAGGAVFGCVPVIRISPRFNFRSLHLCVGKHQFQSRAEHQPPPDIEYQPRLMRSTSLHLRGCSWVCNWFWCLVWSKVLKCNAINSIYLYF